jgi:hypothetical protein
LKRAEYLSGAAATPSMAWLNKTKVVFNRRAQLFIFQQHIFRTLPG